MKYSVERPSVKLAFNGSDELRLFEIDSQMKSLKLVKRKKMKIFGNSKDFVNVMVPSLI